VDCALGPVESVTVEKHFAFDPAAAAMPMAMSKLFYPRSVAVIGASERAGAPAGVVFTNMLQAGWRDRLYPVHPKAEKVHGIPAFAGIADVPDQVDCVVIGVAADKVTAAIEEAAACGARAAVILASGFAELGEDGRARQKEVATVARAAGMAVCGPNCLGLVNVVEGIPLYSAQMWQELPRGGLAILSHSGSGAISLSSSGRLGLSHVVSAGNSAVCDLADYLTFLAEDEATTAAALFMETIHDPRAFERAMAAMHAAGKPVSVLRVGRSKSGAAASAAHTGSLVSSNEAFDDFFRRNGVVVADDMDELIETASLMTTLKSPSAPGVGLMNVSGGEVAHACDVAESVGLTFPALAENTLRILASVLPSFATPSNPLDVTGAVFADPGLYPRCLTALASDPSVGLLVVVQDAPPGLGQNGANNYRKIADHVAEYARTGDKPVVFISNISGGVHPLVRAPLDEAGVPVLQGTRAALKAVLHASRPPKPVSEMRRSPIAQQEKWVTRLKSGRPFSEYDSKAFLRDHGVGTTMEKLARSADESVAIAVQLGFPAVLKIASEDLPHKTEVGGVALNLKNEAELRAAYDKIMVSVAKHAPDASIDGVLVQQMVTGGVEAIVGLTRHHPFGLAVVVGAGGVLVELLKDAALGLPPFDAQEAQRLVESTRLNTLLQGFRGAPAADSAALANLIAMISEIAVAYDRYIEAIDLNPVAVLPCGAGAIVLDALLVPSMKAGAA
jgi:acetate---CoA ligase (ADP-forming)